jgi:peptidoglycan/LPS O-acetylase OafA/YrhL
LIFKFTKKSRSKFLIFIVAIVPVFRILSYQYSISWMDALSLFQRADAIAFGCLLALYERKIIFFIDKLIQKSNLLFFLPVVILLLLFLFAGRIYHPRLLNYIVIAFGSKTIGTAADIAIVFLLVVSINYNTYWFRFLNLPFINFVGKISYSLYLWQQIFLSSILKSFSNFPLNICCIIVMSLFSYYAIERPILKIKRRYEIR